MCTNPLDLVWFLICWCIVCFLYYKVKVTESCAGDVYGILMRRSATHHLLGLLSKKPQHSLQINYLAIIYWSLLKTTPSPTSVLSGSVVNICSKHHWRIWLEREVVYCDKVLNLTCGMHALTIHHLWWRRKSKDDDWFPLRCNPATPTSPHASHFPRPTEAIRISSRTWGQSIASGASAVDELGLWQWPGIKRLEKREEKLGNGNWGVGLALLATLGPP